MGISEAIKIVKDTDTGELIKEIGGDLYRTFGCYELGLLAKLVYSSRFMDDKEFEGNMIVAPTHVKLAYEGISRLLDAEAIKRSAIQIGAWDEVVKFHDDESEV